MRWLVIFLGCLLLADARAQEPTKPPRDLTELSLEELMDVEVTSVSKREQRLAEAAQAVYVVTQEDIRRSGATTIAEALRLAPGVNVAQIDANKWAISARGFNGRFANKLLVLIDGRTVYTPLFSGVFWDVQDTTLEDIERIEVIRGPGATLWGANAVNGVINIITRDAAASQGGLLSAGAGNQEKAFGTLRYGGPLGKSTYYRVAAKWFDRDEFEPIGAGTMANDSWNATRGSFRIDHAIAAADSLMLQADVYEGDYGDVVAIPTLVPPYSRDVASTASFSGSHLLGLWKREFETRGGIALQVYYDRTKRDDYVHRETRDTVDLDFQHTLQFTPRQLIIWGAGFRTTSDDIEGSASLSFDPESRRDDLWSAFVQDELALFDDKIRFTIGSKFEWNDYTGFELQPNVRLLWLPHADRSAWAAVSRAVRTPSRFEHDAKIDGSVTPSLAPFPVLLQLQGSDDYEAEELLSYEAGYRSQVTRRFSIDLASFYTNFEQMRTFEPGAGTLGPGLPIHFVVPITPTNNMSGKSYGVETAATWNATDHWRLAGGHTWLEVELRPSPRSGDTSARGPEGDSPKHQFHLRSYLDLPANLKFDALLFWIDEIPNQEVGQYTRIDARLGWNPSAPLEVSLVLQNITGEQHPEFGTSPLVSPTAVKRSVYGKVTWRF